MADFETTPSLPDISDTNGSESAEAQPVPATSDEPEIGQQASYLQEKAGDPKEALSGNANEPRRQSGKHDSKATEVGPLSHNKGLNDWSTYQPLSSRPKVAGQMASRSGPLPKKKNPTQSLPPKQTTRAFSMLPAANRTSSGLTVAEDRAFSETNEDGALLMTGALHKHSGWESPPFVSPSKADAHVNGTDDANGQSTVLKLRRELENLHNRAELEISGRNQEITRLKGQVALFKEKVTTQSIGLAESLRALDEVKRENAGEVSVCRREGALAERRASSMQARLGAAAANSERVFAAANTQLDAVKGERNTLAEALAAISSAAMGGTSATHEEVATDADAAVAEGSDPLPKRAESWMQYSYGDTVPNNHPQGSRGGLDGERAIHSLIAAVSRLHRRCRDAHGAEQGQRGLVQELEAALNGMTTEYNAVEVTSADLFNQAITVQQLCGIVGLAPSKVEKGIVGRLKQVTHILEHVHGAFEEHKVERARMHSQIIELDFYSKLHLRLLETAKIKVSADDHSQFTHLAGASSI